MSEEMKSVGRGQTLVRSFGTDKSDVDVKNSKSCNMGGGKDNLAHSLKGATANQRAK